MKKSMKIVVVMFAILLAASIPLSPANAAKKNAYSLYLIPKDSKGAKPRDMFGVVNKVTFSGNKITIIGRGIPKNKSGKPSRKK